MNADNFDRGTILPHKAGKSLSLSAQHFATDLNLYNTDIVDYTLVNVSPVRFIAVVCIIKY